MIYNKLKYCLIAVVVFYACSPRTVTRTSTVETYSEDLSVHRPKFEVKEASENDNKQEIIEEIKYPEPKFDVTKELNSVLDSIDILRNNITFVDGFTVQVYSGTSSEEAKIAKGKVFSILSDVKPVLNYDEPNFKVKVGKFYSRLEAQKTFAQLKKKLPNSIIIPERIYLNEID